MQIQYLIHMLLILTMPNHRHCEILKFDKNGNSENTLIMILLDENTLMCPMCKNNLISSLDSLALKIHQRKIIALLLPDEQTKLTETNISILRQQLYGFVKANNIKIPFSFYPSHALSDKIQSGAVVIHYTAQQIKVEPLSKYHKKPAMGF